MRQFCVLGSLGPDLLRVFGLLENLGPNAYMIGFRADSLKSRFLKVGLEIRLDRGR